MAKRQGARNRVAQDPGEPTPTGDGLTASWDAHKAADPDGAALIEQVVAEGRTVDGAGRHAVVLLEEAVEKISHLNARDDDGRFLASMLVLAGEEKNPGRPRPGFEEARALALLQEIARARDAMSTHVQQLALAISREHGTSAARLGEVASIANSTVSRWIKADTP